MARELDWFGHTWSVRDHGSSAPEGPGENWWSNSDSNVWVDGDGRLHLKLRKEGNRWLASEIYTQETFKYGKFIWKIEGPVSSPTGSLDKNVVFGLFTYKDSDFNNEIDIELARWGNSAWPNLNYTIYPSTETLWDDLQREQYTTTFEMQLNGNYTSHMFEWREEQVVVSSRHGHSDDGDVILQWSTPSNAPERVPQSECAVHMNLWIAENQTAPSDAMDVEFVIHNFTYQA